MAHCPHQKLNDVEDILDEVRSWKGVLEVKPGIFYIKRKPFLHFHEKDGARWADVRRGLKWGPQLEIPFSASKKMKNAFLASLRDYHDETCSALNVK